MTRVRKEKDIRRQELIDTAIRLFMEHGYKNVSVQDILKEVNGQNGMFYHHFKCKDEIYDASLSYFIDSVAQARLTVLKDKSIPFIQRLQSLCESVVEDSGTFVNIFGIPKDLSFLIEAIEGFITILIKPTAEALIEAKKEGIIPADSIICEDNAEAAARFILHGSNSLARIRPEEYPKNDDADMVLPFIKEFLKIK